jgi:hypothetical protein
VSLSIGEGCAPLPPGQRIRPVACPAPTLINPMGPVVPLGSAAAASSGRPAGPPAGLPSRPTLQRTAAAPPALSPPATTRIAAAERQQAGFLPQCTDGSVMPCRAFFNSTAAHFTVGVLSLCA